MIARKIRHPATMILILYLFSTFLMGLESELRFSRVSLEENLSHRSVSCILQDRLGFMWFGTGDGLNRFDGFTMKVFRHNSAEPGSLSGNQIAALFEDGRGVLWVGVEGHGLHSMDKNGETFTRYLHVPEDTHSLSSNNVWSILEDAQGTLWIGTDKGLNHLDRKTGQFKRFLHDPNNQNSLSHNQIRTMCLDRFGEIWVGTNGGGVNRFNPDTETFVRFQKSQDNPEGLSDDLIRSIYQDSHGDIWIGAFSDGLDRYHRATGVFEHYPPDPNQTNALSDGLVTAVLEDRNGRLWVGTNGGLDLLNPATGEFTHFKHNMASESSLSHNSVWTIYEDRAGVIWVGTDGGGISKLDPDGGRFMSHGQMGAGGLSHNDVWALNKEENGYLWIGSNGGGLNRYDPELDEYTPFLHDPSDSGSLSHNSVRSLVVSRDGDLWVGTGNGLNHFNREEEIFTYYQPDPMDPEGISDGDILSLMEDRMGRIWIGTKNGGLNCLDPDSETFKTYLHNPNDPISLSSNTVLPVYEDRSGTLWVGTWGEGLDMFDPDREVFTNYRARPDQVDGLSHNDINVIYEDRGRNLWVGTQGGLNLLNREANRFSTYKVKDGLPNDVILGILADGSDRLWLSTGFGLVRMDPKTGRVRVYDRDDGLPGERFNPMSFFQSSSGEMFFGGDSGYCAFYPETIKDNLTPPPVILTSFHILNEEVDLEKPVYLQKSLDLSYRDIIFSFEFAALSYANSQKNTYAYKLENYQDEWVHTGSSRVASFSNVSPGKYTLRVKAANSDGIWNEQGAVVNIHIKPPFWKTWWAGWGYLLITAYLVWSYARLQQRKLSHERALARKEQLVASRLRQLNKLKDEFLANTSHELRTPLNGIIGLAESLADGAAGNLPAKARKDLSMIVASGRRLGSLVNDILDFSMLKNRTLELNAKPIDLYSLTNVVIALNQPLVGNRYLELVNEIRPDTPPVLADENRLLQIMHNLIGNAVKFTDSGRVTIASILNSDYMTIQVKDTGAGIPEERLPYIFQTFEQADGSTVRSGTGTGLGLSISRQLVELHGGILDVESTFGVGSTFSFTLPLATGKVVPVVSSGDILLNPPLIEEVQDGDWEGENVASFTRGDDSVFRILIVDDEPVNRKVLANHLSLQDYHITEASGGAEALMAVEEGGNFDLILLDIMMPRMSGYEVCQRLRELYPVNELPIIFLSAKNQVAGLVTGFGSGANDYLTKPISKDELLSRVRTHLLLLDINRNLEEKVAERTREAEARNKEVLHTQQQLIMKDKMASLGTLTAGVAHEIRNPLNFIVNLSGLTGDLAQELYQILEPYQALLGDGSYDEVDEIIKDIAQNSRIIKGHGNKAHHIVKSMMDLAREDSGTPQATNLNALIEEFTTLAYHSKEAKKLAGNIQFQKKWDRDIGMVNLESTDFSRTIVHLTNNAIESVEARRALETDDYLPQICIQTQKKKDQLIILIRDNGLGIAQENIRKIFTPFFTTRAADGENVGLGLSFCYDVLTHHGGELKVSTVEGEFCEFTVVIPYRPVH